MADKYQVKSRSHLRSIGALCALWILSAVLPGCASGPGDADVERLAEMEVRAITLREQRFALANEIRFTQDTLLRTDSGDARAAELEAKLKVFAARKDSLLVASLALADTIKQNLDSIIDPDRYSREEREAFNAQLNEEVKRRSPALEGK